MGGYLARRLAVAASTIVVTTFLTFLLLRMVPGEPAQIILTRVFIKDQTVSASRADIDAVAQRFGLDAPLVVQYGRWMGAAAAGDLGISIRTNRPVATELGWRLRNTGLLALLSTAVSLALTFAFVSLTRLIRKGWMTSAVDALSIVSIGMPAFYLGIALIIVFSLRLDWLPVSGFSTWAHVVLPVVVLAGGTFGFNMALLTGVLDEAYAQPYIVTARAKGLGAGDVLLHHALRNALVPLVPYLALEFAFLIGGVLVVEQLFGVPGIGAYLVEALGTHDIPALLGTVALIATALAFCNLLADVTASLLDPRIHLAGGGSDQ